MKLRMEYGLVVFDSTHEAIRTETIAKKNHFHSRLISTPGEISAGCGLSLRFELMDTTKLLKVLKNNSVAYKNIYHAYLDGLNSKYTLIIK